ncbi:MAG: hypothetical protein FWH04_07335 [Oscillospiraceae bacterium]|nr:hypothetical protein [Oscillospiraceae bacterium]
MENVLKMLWKDRCDVFCREGEFNPKNGRTEFREIMVLDDIPCKLSFTGRRRTRAAGPTKQGQAASAEQEVTLFLSREAEIPPGSKIVVTRHGTPIAYKQSGKPNIYSNHQEIGLALFEKWI